MAIDITAVICTHNRSDYLKKALNSLYDQTLSADRYEIIVVDNASADDTRAVVEAIGAERAGAGRQMRYVYEAALGLSNARNTALAETQGRYIAYLDDDAIAVPEWLETLLSVFEGDYPGPGCVGGRVDPIWEAPRPSWLPDGLLTYLTIVNWGDERMLIHKPLWVAGANMAFDTELLRQVGGFSSSLGRKGNLLLSNEETALMQRIEDIGRDIIWEPSASVSHHAPPDRLTKKWFRSRARWQGISHAVLAIYAMEDDDKQRRERMRLLKHVEIYLSPVKYLIKYVISLGRSKENFYNEFQLIAEISYIKALISPPVTS
jgi:glycosyltransferase involved in cell wall biosynthesis